ncbi:MAG: ribonuclease T2 [Roseibium sp.]|uniref:ribonuclease T2 n=1 Tax=Roseibium sp. TaxID=1936156 RepID=UPI00261282AB|nr:ribonuclease T2 [Roseibium sp.]MCV0424499.1 ribonuclease T2 [Roseibium sp.]
MALFSRAWSLAACLIIGLVSGSASADTPGEFDFYVLSLSWSPTYCKQKGDDANPHQCSGQEPFRFIVHGLWPQYERGYPANCPGVSQRIDRQIAVDMEDIMPSHGLVFHQWRKHGTCSGLDPEDYFDLTREAFEKITIPGAFKTLNKRGKASPDTVEKAFRVSNPGLLADGMAVICENGELEEVRICLTKDLDFRSCDNVDRSACRINSLSVPPPRTR